MFVRRPGHTLLRLSLAFDLTVVVALCIAAQLMHVDERSHQ
jgi:hypothetical protein